MTFSIIIPTYNGASYVREAIESALSQTRPADEVIISDDNSKDNTVDICRSYGPRVKIYQNPDGPSGFVNGWNNAISHAESEFIVILHQDDLLDPNFLEEIENCVRLHPDVKHFFAPCRYIDGNRTVLREPSDYCTGEIHRYTGQEYANAYERYKNHIHRCPGVVTHRDIFKKCKYRSIAGHIADDDFFLRVGNYTDVVGVLKPLASYREHKGSETGHLSFLSINRRLLRDYHFQLTHRKENPLISDEITDIFKVWEVEYIHRLIVYGIKSLNLKYIVTAVKYWLYSDKDNKFMNIVTDVKLLKRYVKDLFRKTHVRYLNRPDLHDSVLCLNDMTKIVIFAPHPDDEVIGCGGLIARLVAEGRPPHVVVMTGGGGSHRGCCSTPEADIIRARRGLTRDALAVLGLPEENIHELDYTDGDIHAGHPQTDELKALIGRLQPDTVFVPHWGEGWSDHIRTAEIVKELLDPDVAVVEYCVWMWYYNVWRGLDWKNALRVDLSAEEHALKLRAIDAYIVPKAPCGKPWSGVLPKIFIDANKGKSELYFKVK